MKILSIFPVLAPIVSIGLYQNDLAVVTRKVTPSSGTAVVSVGNSSPIDGTFWYSSPVPLKVRAYEPEWRATVTFVAPAMMRGVIEEAEKASGRAVFIGGFEGCMSLRMDGVEYSLFTVSGRFRGSAMLSLELDSGSKIGFANLEHIVSIEGDGAAVMSSRGSESLSAWEFSGAENPFGIEYLTEGAGWNPSYRLEMADEKASLWMSGKIRNDIADWDEAEVSLISGNANISRGNPRPEPRGGVKRMKSNRMMMVDAAMCEEPSDGYNVGIGGGQGSDMHYRPIGRVSLRSGDSLTLPLGAEEVEVKRLVEWSEEGVWDAVKFSNPFVFPMAAGTIEVVENGRILGMPNVKWVNVGDETFVRITEANSVKGIVEEAYVDEAYSKAPQDKTTTIGNHVYHRHHMVASFSVANFRAQKVAMSVRRMIVGDIASSTLEPTKMRDLPPRDYGVNAEHELTWEFELEEGERREFKVEYSYLRR